MLIFGTFACFAKWEKCFKVTCSQKLEGGLAAYHTLLLNMYIW